MHPVHHARAEHEAHAHAHLHRSGYARGGRMSDERQDKAMVEKGVHQHERHDHKGEKETDLKLKGGGKVKGHHPKERMDRRARGGRTKRRDDGGEVGNGMTSGDVGDPYNKKLGSQTVSQQLKSLGSRASNQEFNLLRNAAPKFSDYTPGDKRGGPVKRAKGGRTPSKINIIIATGGGEPERQMAQRQGMQLGAKLGALAGGAAKPPMMPPPGMGAPPPGMPPGGPPMPPPGAMPPPRPPMGAMPPGGMARGGRMKSLGAACGTDGSPPNEYDTVRDQTHAVQRQKRAEGGRIGRLKGDAGAGGGKGRLEKEGMVSVKAHKRRAGGRV